MDFQDKDKDFLHNIAETLSSKEVLSLMYRHDNLQTPMPDIKILRKIIKMLRAVLFPGYFGTTAMKSSSMKFYLGAYLDEIFQDLALQIKRGYCFECAERYKEKCAECEIRSKNNARELLEKLPRIRHLLATDAEGAFEGDPASNSFGEIIFCYPGLKALTNHRIAHELFKMNIPVIPRIISEMAHSETGIDIHPGATIGEKLFIDHGTGVVIGETCTIGNNVKIYQNVTLGAKSFPLDEKGNPIKNIDRHPKVEDNVTIYSGATILGNIVIGQGSVIGGNVWLTESIAANTKLRAKF